MGASSLIGSAALHAAVIGVLAGAATLPSGREIAPLAIEVTLTEPMAQDAAEAAPAPSPEPPLDVAQAPAAEAVSAPAILAPPVPAPPVPATVMAVAAPPPVIRPVEVKRAPEARPRPAQVAALSPVAAAPAVVAASDPTPKPVEISADWQRQLVEWLRANQRYPEDARRRNLTGKTQVRFVVERDGAVTEVTILRSSGSDLLDNSARALLSGARVPAFPASMPQDAVPVSLPINFSLNN
jgi:periplasmic protein TonB